MSTDGAIIFIGLATAIFALYGPRASALTPLATVVLVAYPVVFLASGGAALIGALTARAQFRTLNAPYLLLLGLGISGACWVIWNSLALDQIIPPGTIVAYGFSFAHLVVGLGVGVWDCIPSTSPRFNRWAKLSLWVLPVIIIPMTVILMESPAIESSSLRSPIIIGGAIVIILAVIRQSLLLIERDRLLTRERDALERAEQELAERKRAEAELRQSEERYRRLIDHARDVIFTISTDGIITSLNPAFEIFTGWSRAEWLGRAFDELVAEDDRIRAHDQFNQILRGETLRALRLRMHTRTGEILVVEMNISPQFKDDQVVGLLGIARDMTQEQQAEDALKASEERYRMMFEANPHPMWVYDQETLDFLAVNEAATAHYGYSREEFLRMTIKDIRPPEEIPALMDNLVQKPQKLEVVVLAK